MDTRQQHHPAPPTPAGLAIDNEARPSWVADHLSTAQLGNDPGLQWISLLEMACGLGKTAKAAAHLLWRSCAGKKIKKAWPSVTRMCDLTDTRSRTTMCAAIRRLVRDGWLLREVRDAHSRKTAPERPGLAGVGYRLAWPRRDCLTPTGEAPQICASSLDRGGICTTRAGKGTTHRGEGPCWRHGGQRANASAAIKDAQTLADRAAEAAQQAEAMAAEAAAAARAADEATAAAAEVQPVPPVLHLVDHSSPGRPVDISPVQPPLLQVVDPGMVQPLDANGPVVSGAMVQPLDANGPVVGTEVFSSALTEDTKEENGGSCDHGAEVEGARGRPEESKSRSFSVPGSASGPAPTIVQAHLILDALPPGRRDWLLQRARMHLAAAGTGEPTLTEVVLAAAAAAARVESA